MSVGMCKSDVSLSVSMQEEDVSVNIQESDVSLFVGLWACRRVMRLSID